MLRFLRNEARAYVLSVPFLPSLVPLLSCFSVQRREKNFERWSLRGNCARRAVTSDKCTAHGADARGAQLEASKKALPFLSLFTVDASDFSRKNLRARRGWLYTLEIVSRRVAGNVFPFGRCKISVPPSTSILDHLRILKNRYVYLISPISII